MTALIRMKTRQEPVWQTELTGLAEMEALLDWAFGEMRAVKVRGADDGELVYGLGTGLTLEVRK
jgi:hypothetical protein